MQITPELMQITPETKLESDSDSDSAAIWKEIEASER